MKEFFKSIFASTIGCVIAAIVISIFMFFSLIALSFGSSGEQYDLKKNTIFSLKLEGELVERSQENNPFMELMGVSDVKQLGLDDILSAIRKAKENDEIKGIYIYNGAFMASGASLKEIRDQLLDFKESGKFIIAYGDTYTQGCYYLSSVADKVILNPKGMIDLHGLSASTTFYKGLLEKIGVEMQIFKVGTFKSAVEPFILDKMSDANKEQLNSFITDSWSTLLNDISESRKIPVENLNQLVDSLVLLIDPSKHLENHLIDTMMYENDMKEYLQKCAKIEDIKKMRFATVQNMATVSFQKKSKSDNVIAVLYAEGGISSGNSNSEITDKRYVKELQKLKEDKDVKAVVFRINSGGGSAYASEQIWKAVSELKEKKPVVVSMGDYAASGGYYIACNASKIIAQPNTLTGSIGIFGMFPNVEGLTHKIGLTYDQVKTSKFGDFGDVSRPMRDDEKVYMQAYINRGYDLFLTRCSEGRGIPKDSLDKIAQGRIWTGNQALKLGLVDAIGGIDVAINEAVKLANIENYKLSNYPAKMDFFQAILEMQKNQMATNLLKEYLGADYHTFKMLKEIKDQDVIQARIPYELQIK